MHKFRRYITIIEGITMTNAELNCDKEKTKLLTNRKDKIVLIFIFTLLYFTFLFQSLRLVPSQAPFEDSAMLLRYIENISNGHGIRWNKDQPPVDGGTDFLYIVTSGFISNPLKACSASSTNTNTIDKGYNPTLSIVLRTANITFCLLFVGILFSILAKPPKRFSLKKIYLPASIVFVFLFGSGFWYTRAHFPTIFFCIFVFLAYYVVYLISEPSENLDNTHQAKSLKSTTIYFAVFCLLMGLARPEGVFLAIFMLIGIYISAGKKIGWAFTKSFLLIFGILGSAYFAWRWWYFGHPLPNPFYKKNSGGLHFTSLRISISNVIKFGAPFIIIFLISLKKGLSKQKVGMLIPIILFTIIWVLISNEMNYMGRFQYPIFVMLGLLAIYCANDVTSILKNKIFLIAFSLIFAAEGAMYLDNLCQNKSKEFFYNPHPAGRYDLANTLSDFKHKGYTIAVTEAGLLPFYSKWKAIDCWGLNDSWIAKHKQVTPEYLDRFKPEIIMVHKTPVSDLPGWQKMCNTLENYAKSRNYILAGSFGRTKSETHDYYVKPNFADADKLVNIIKNYPYIWFKDRKFAINFATLKDGKDVNSDLPK